MWGAVRENMELETFLLLESKCKALWHARTVGAQDVQPVKNWNMGSDANACLTQREHYERHGSMCPQSHNHHNDYDEDHHHYLPHHRWGDRLFIRWRVAVEAHFPVVVHSFSVELCSPSHHFQHKTDDPPAECEPCILSGGPLSCRRPFWAVSGE